MRRGGIWILIMIFDKLIIVEEDALHVNDYYE